MKTKLEMAHDYLRDIVSNWEYDDSFDPVAEAWQYADAMQAEADKREKEEQGEHVFEAIEGLQPNWIQAPDWANWWCINNIGSALFYDEKPEISNNGFLGNRYCYAPSFNYQGDWRNSLRKRPK